jgi:hypothetical protein
MGQWCSAVGDGVEQGHQWQCGLRLAAFTSAQTAPYLGF